MLSNLFFSIVSLSAYRLVLEEDGFADKEAGKEDSGRNLDLRDRLRRNGLKHEPDMVNPKRVSLDHKVGFVKAEDLGFIELGFSF